MNNVLTDEAQQQIQKLEQEIKHLQSLVEQKNEFIANVSHEIRTPMNGILSMVELLLKTPLTAQQQDYADTLHISIEALFAIVDDLFDLSKIENGKFELHAIEFDPRLIIEEVAELVAERAQHKGLELYLDLDVDLPYLIRGDTIRLRQVLTNLVDNAVKFTEKGEIALSVHVQEETLDNVLLRFSVHDTGIGISADLRERLLQPFPQTQVDLSLDSRHGGTGLGLIISRQIVELMSGSVGVDSELGKGSDFWFTVSFPKVNNPEVVQKMQNRPSLAGLKILVVMAHEGASQALIKQLAAWNINYDQTYTFADAFQLLTNTQRWFPPYDVIILDINLPDLDDALILRKHLEDTPLAGMKWLLLTRTSEHPQGISLYEQSFDRLLSKPIRHYRFYDELAHISRRLNPLEISARPSYVLHDKPISIIKDIKILAVEDNIINQKVLLMLLSTLNIKCDVATNGQETLNILKKQRYDLILMDCQMPDIDGTEVTRLIRIMEQERNEPRPAIIIALTAHTLEEKRLACLQSGMNDFLVKPLHLEDLQLILEKWFNIAQQADMEHNESAHLSNVSNVLIDIEALLTIYQHDKRIVVQLLELYMDTAKKTLDQLLDAIKLQDHKASRLAHDIKGASAYIRAHAIQNDAKNVELAVKNQQWEEAEQHWRKLRQDFSETIRFINQFIKS